VKVAVFGASGTIGGALLPQLAAEHDVVAISRRKQPEGPPGVGWGVADAADASSVRRVLAGAEVV
jgi:uncharacterized protein YbjT (DUF2867 family)